MIYLLIAGAIIFLIAAIIIIYCWLVYSAMLNDIKHYDIHENRTTESEIDL